MSEIPVALYQSCLRARAFDDYAAMHAFACVCGEGPENYCNCLGCIGTVLKLKIGLRERAVLGLQPGAEILSWSAPDGLVEAG